MPQIWMTDDELASLFECEATSVRAIDVMMKLDRRKSSDGNTRVKLTTALNELFLDKFVRHQIDRELQACAGDLRAARDKMAVRQEYTAAQIRRGQFVG
jgi:hypothetical protein